MFLGFTDLKFLKRYVSFPFNIFSLGLTVVSVETFDKRKWLK